MSEPSRKNIFKSMFAVQRSLSAVSKSGSNPHLKTAYATLPDVLEELLPKCHEAGLFISHRQMECDTPGMIRVELMVIHAESGEYMESDWFMPIGSGGAQAVGSALSYVRRYSLMNVFGMSTSDDDDGHAATQAHLSRPTQQARQQAQNYQREAPYAATSQLPAPGYVVDANEPVTDRQTAMLNSLGYTGKQPTTKVEAGQIISRMKAQR